MKYLWLVTEIFLTLLFTTNYSAGQTNYYSSEEIEIKLAGGTLSGTFFKPLNINNPPVVLIIAGSGPTDRDGNSPMLSGKNNSLLQLADSLAKNGIASVRYDKRGIGKSKFPKLREDSMLFSDGVNDAVAWCDWLKDRKYKKIFIAGHSEGSLIGMSAASIIKVKGFISIAGAGRRIDYILKEQFAQLPDSLRPIANSYVDSLVAGNRIAKPNIRLFSIFRPSVQRYIISWLQYDPQKIISNLKCPVLIIQGTNDLQVNEKDANNLYKAKPSSTLLLIKNMNHVLKEVWSDKAADNSKAYSNPALPVMHELVSGIVSFIHLKKK